MSASKKPICIHFHIFKNAGTTIDWILKKNFGKNHLTMDYQATNPAQIFSWEQVLNFLKKYPDVKAFSSHIIRFPIPEDTPFNFLPMVFIRHPIDRAFSIYGFQRKRTDSDRPGIIKAKELNLNDYIKWNFKVKKFRPMKSFQVLYLSHKDTKSVVDENDLKMAIKHMKECPIIGVVDRFDESMVLAEEVLQYDFPSIDLSSVKQNISKERMGDLTQRINSEKSKLNESVWKQLLKENELDLELYRKTNEELDNRLNKIENFNEKLTNFQKRCK